MTQRIACLPGDGIGPEVTAEAVRVLEALPVDVDLESSPFGGAAIDGAPAPSSTVRLHTNGLRNGILGREAISGMP